MGKFVVVIYSLYYFSMYFFASFNGNKPMGSSCLSSTIFQVSLCFFKIISCSASYPVAVSVFDIVKYVSSLIFVLIIESDIFLELMRFTAVFIAEYVSPDFSIHL